MNKLKLKPVDWQDRTLIKLHRRYGKDEVVVALNNKIKSLEDIIAKQKKDIEIYKKLIR